MHSKNTFVYGILLGILGIVMFSSKAVMVKLTYQYNVDAISVLFLRMLFSFPFYIIIAIFFTRKLHKIKSTKITQKDYYWVIIFGVLGYYLASYFDFVGLTYIKASLERIILFLYPTIVLLLNQIFLKKRITRPQAFAIVITYIGIIIAFWEDVNVSGSKAYLGVFFVLLSAVTYASYLVGSGWLIPKFGVLRFTSYAMIVSCVCVFVHYGFTYDIDIFGFAWQVYLLGFLIAVIATVVPSFLVSQSIKMISSSNFAVVAGIGPISTIVLAVIFLEETLSVWQYIGTLVVICGIIAINVMKINTQE